MQDVEQLSLVLMDSLHVNIKHGVHIHRDPSVLIQVLLQLQLVVL